MNKTQFSDVNEQRFSFFDIKISNLNKKRLWGAENREVYLLAVVSILLLAIPSQDSTVFGYVLAALLGLFGAMSLYRWVLPANEEDETQKKIMSLHRLDTPLPEFVEGAVSIFVAGFLILEPAAVSELFIQAVGVCLILYFAYSLFQDLVLSNEHHQTHSIAWYVLMVATGLFLIIWPLTVVGLATSVAAVFGLAVSAIVMVVNLFGGRTRALQLIKLPQFFEKWLRDRSVTKAEREHLYESIFYEGRSTQKRVNHYVILMVLASGIASFGVIAESTAVVIGAMLVAPLMTPLMATATSLVMSWPKRLVKSATLSAAGALIGVGVGWVISGLVPGDINLLENSEVASRTLPTLLDLGIAVAAGAAGAYSMSRPDLSDSLSGVAVSIALVPPLAVTGIALEQGAFSDASGSFLLFLTNAVAILLTGGLVLVLTGVTPIHRIRSAQKRFRTLLLAVEMLGIVVVGALILNGQNIATSALSADQTRAVVAEWLGGSESDFRLNSLRFDSEDYLILEVTGPDEAPSAEELKTALKDDLGKDFSIELRFITQQRQLVQ